MIQLPYPRLNKIFDALIDHVLPQDELAQLCQVSTRTIRTDISALNDTLASYGAQINHFRGKGYQFDIYDPNKFSELEQQHNQAKVIPRNSKDRMIHLMMRLLSQEKECKLDELANQWFVSRTSLQADMSEIRNIFEQYNLTLESRAYKGLTLHGKEQAIRACISHILYHYESNDQQFDLICELYFPEINQSKIKQDILVTMKNNHIHLTGEGIYHLLVYCGVALHRIKKGFQLDAIEVPQLSPESMNAGQDLANILKTLIIEESIDLQKPVQAEIDYLCIQIAARRVLGANISYLTKLSEPSLFVDYLLDYINQHYCYDLRNDSQLRHDLLSHVTTMLLRIKYQIALPNPLIEHIKSYYPLAYDMAVAAASHAREYQIPATELGYLVMHIGVGLERNFAMDKSYMPSALLVCNSGTSMARLIESQINKTLPQLKIVHYCNTYEYEQYEKIEADIVLSTEKLTHHNKPVLMVSNVPTPFQLDQINKHILNHRTPPYVLECFFDKRYFKILKGPTTQAELFRELTLHFEDDGIVPQDFYPSVIERESIASTILGEGIAIPHSIGLVANETKVYTVFSPEGIDWGNGQIVHVIFLFAIKQDDYEEAMGLYELFVTFMDAKAASSLLDCSSFESFLHFAKQCWLKCKKEW